MIISQTPLRISFVGGGTDLPAYYRKFGGKVVSTAIDKFVYVLITSRYDDRIVAGYSKQEIVNSINDIQHDLIRETARMVGLVNGFEVKTMADIPSEGSGLGSSSAITVGLLNAFYAYRGIQVSSFRLAEEACKIEIDVLKNPIGKQDQYSCAMGGYNAITFNKDDTVDIVNLKEDVIFQDFLLFGTGMQRKSSAILLEQNYLLDSKIELYHALKLLSCEQKPLYELITRDWEIKKRLAPNITNPEIETMIEIARSGGVTGYKILGAGGGGFLLVYCPREYQSELRRIMSSYRELPFKSESSGSRIIFNHKR